MSTILEILREAKVTLPISLVQALEKALRREGGQGLEENLQARARQLSATDLIFVQFVILHMLAVTGEVLPPRIDVIERGLLQGLGGAVERGILAKVLGHDRGDLAGIGRTCRLGRVIAPRPGDVFAGSLPV